MGLRPLPDLLPNAPYLPPLVWDRPHRLAPSTPSDQHRCADKGSDYPDVHRFVSEQGYQKHIKHRRRQGEPKPDPCPIPGETHFPARRWIAERTLAKLAKRRSIRIRWCKKSNNWLSFIHLACASILADMTIFGWVLNFHDVMSPESVFYCISLQINLLYKHTNRLGTHDDS